MSLHCVIMAGGVGARFWPLSTAERPKQCLSFDDQKSLLQNTVTRARLLPHSTVSVITGPAMKAAIVDQLCQEESVTILTEPSSRNTFPCFLWAIVQAKMHGAEQVVIWPSDHDISPVEDWITTHQKGLQASNDFDVIVIGIQPTKAHTGYGYIEVQEEMAPLSHQPVLSFHEKPNAQTAEDYLSSQRFLWNSGVIIANVERLLSSIAKMYPEVESLYSELERSKISAAVWEQLLATSFDYAVLEKSSSIGVIASNVTWNDLGSWDSIRHLLEQRGSHSVKNPELFSIDSNNCLVYTQKRVSLLGVQDLIIVETEQELLIMDASCAQRVKEIKVLIDKENL